MKLKTRLAEVPGGWVYTQPDTGWTKKAITFNSLVQAVARHRANMALPIPGDLAAEIEETICKKLSPENQVAHCEDGTTHPKSVHWSLVERFLKTAVAYMLGPDSLVPQEEAERRASICAKCPLNVGLHGCAVCRATLNSLREKLLDRHTEQDSLLGACGICGCDNRVQVHVPIPALTAGSGDLVYPESWCWKAAGGVNESKT